MLKPNQRVFIKWNSRNREWYVSKGYTFTKFGEPFEVNIEDLTKGSKAEVVVLCDHCGKEVVKRYQTYLRQHDLELGDCCASCQYIKAQKTWKLNYGVDNPFKSDIIKDKIKDTCRAKYNTERACQSDIVKDKIKNTCRERFGADSNLGSDEERERIKQTFIENYGVENPFMSKEIQKKIEVTNLAKFGCKKPLQNEDIKEKREQTFMERYGVKAYSQTQECKDRTIQTNLEKYGYKYTLQVPEIRQKGMETMLKNGLVSTSSQQIKVQEMLKEMYGNCDLNVPCGNCFLDCVTHIDGVNFDVEYDGAYWHQDLQRDRRRDEFVKTQGYRIVRIKGSHEVPTKEQLQNAINKLLNTGNKFTHIDLV